ncbi:MAG TPA: alpha/beta fold hydrolase [Actinomycetota bacterium]|jgi:pimeloyl-ACP methyl ester carboxylesterase|nr:alpha/beta fold hydrolase [Actinomycetota bacterium]
MPVYNVNGLDINADVTGDGFPLILIAGTGLPAVIWGFHVGWLSEQRRVVAFDNRDIGASGSAPGDYTPTDMAGDAIGLMDALGIERADVVGFSLGGAIAQEVALAVPDRVRGLVLYATWASTDAWLRLRFEVWERIAAAVAPDTITDLGALELYTHRFFADPAPLEMLRASARAAPNERGPDGFIRQWRADQAHDARDRLGGIRSPTLVVVGDEDVLVPRRYSQELVELIPGAKLQVIAEAGHGALVERPDAFRAVVEPFLKELEG